MRKRHRKKKHIGEFKNYAVSLAIRFDKASRNFDDFLGAFITEAVEANHCYTAAGGGVDGDKIEGTIELGIAGGKPLERLKAIRSWVESQPDVLAHRFSPVTDIWYGPFYEFDAEMDMLIEQSGG